MNYVSQRFDPPHCRVNKRGAIREIKYFFVLMIYPSLDTSDLIDFNKQQCELIVKSVWTRPRHSPAPHQSIPQCQDLFTFALPGNSLELYYGLSANQGQASLNLVWDQRAGSRGEGGPTKASPLTGARQVNRDKVGRSAGIT